MSAPTNDTHPRAIVRLASDAGNDFELAVQQATSEAYLEWPNKAGFENLTEQRGPIQLVVHGVIPSWATGSLYRTGPGINEIDNVPGQPNGVLKISHFFDGLAHTHRFDITPDPDRPNQAQVVYSSRRQSDGWVEEVQKNGLRETITFAQKLDPCIGIFGKFMSTWRLIKTLPRKAPIENVGVTVQVSVPAGGLRSSANGGSTKKQELWLGSDNSMLRELDFDTLDPLGIHLQNEMHPELDGQSSCAHAMYCPETGDYFNVNIKSGPVAKYRIFRISAQTGEVDILAEIARKDVRQAYIHSFFMSEHFVVLRLPSSHIKGNGLGILWEKNVLDAIVPFDEKNKCKWFVVDRVHGRGVVAEFETDAAFFFHSVNCFEEPSSPTGDGTPKTTIICDVVEYPTTDIIHTMSYDALLNREGAAKDIWGDRTKAENCMPRLVRWKLKVPSPTTPLRKPSGTKPSAAEKMLTFPTPHAGEMPTINPDFATRRHRYVYSLSMGGRSTHMEGLVKTDIDTGSVRRWNNAHGHTPSEAIFVARSGATEEDDGVLLSVVLDGTAEKSYLLCLDAGTMMETGRAEMDFAVGHGFHGVHVSTGSPDI